MNGIDQMLLIGAGLAAVAAAVYMVTGGKPKAAIQAAIADTGASTSTLAGAMESIDVQAKARAYDKVSDKLVTHRAGRYESELLDALAPKGEAAQAKP